MRCGHDAQRRNSKLVLTRRFNVSNGLPALRLQRICPTISDDEKPCVTNPATVNGALIFSIGLPFEIRSLSEAFILFEKTLPLPRVINFSPASYSVLSRLSVVDWRLVESQIRGKWRRV